VIKTTEERWEQGIPHHPAAKWLARQLNKVSDKYGDGAIDLRFGGDGDNGEELCYHLSIIFENSKDIKHLIEMLRLEEKEK
jgi:hypothetical protein